VRSFYFRAAARALGERALALFSQKARLFDGPFVNARTELLFVLGAFFVGVFRCFVSLYGMIESTHHLLPNRWKSKLSTAGTGVERPNPNPVPRDYAERPAKIRLRLNQRQDHVRSLLRGIRRDAEQDNPAPRRQPAAENELAEILVERQEDSPLVRAESRDFLIRDTGHSSAIEKTSQPAFCSTSRAGRGKFSSARILMPS
jgi:hypothetical protein